MRTRFAKKSVGFESERGRGGWQHCTARSLCVDVKPVQDGIRCEHITFLKKKGKKRERKREKRKKHKGEIWPCSQISAHLDTCSPASTFVSPRAKAILYNFDHP